MSEKERASLERLLQVLDRLLDPESGCPWDLKQTPDSIRLYLLEETYELLDAVEDNEPDHVREELGDCLFILCFLTRLFEKGGHFQLKDVIAQAAAKMIARHPHIFGDGPNLEDAEAVRVQWSQLKKKEKKSLLGGVPRNLPALQRTHRLGRRAAEVGFDWERADQVMESLEGELAELKAEMAGGQTEAALAELGDVLFTAANLARHLGGNAEETLRAGNRRFTDRFEYIERKLAESGRDLESADLAEMDRLWDEAKVEGY